MADGDLLVIDEAAEAQDGDAPWAPEPVDRAPAVVQDDAAPARPKGLIGQVLVKRGLVTEAQIAQALQQQADSGKRLGEVLIDMGALDERGLVDALADFYGMSVTDLRRNTPFPEALALVPEEIAGNTSSSR